VPCCPAVCQASLSETAGEIESLRAQLTEAVAVREDAVTRCSAAEDTSRESATQVEALTGKLAAAEATAASLQERAANSGEATAGLELQVKAAQEERDEAVASATQAQTLLADAQQQAMTAAAEAAENEGKAVELQARLDVAVRAEEESAAQLIKLRERGAYSYRIYICCSLIRTHTQLPPTGHPHFGRP
jgi:chromosome segregation ATPase